MYLIYSTIDPGTKFVCLLRKPLSAEYLMSTQIGSRSNLFGMTYTFLKMKRFSKTELLRCQVDFLTLFFFKSCLFSLCSYKIFTIFLNTKLNLLLGVFLCTYVSCNSRIASRNCVTRQKIHIHHHCRSGIR